MQKRRKYFEQAILALGCMASNSCASTPNAPAHLAWNRAAFGPRPGDLDNFEWERFLEEQLNPQHVDDTYCQQRLEQAELTTLHKPFERLWSEHYLAMDQAESDEDWDWVQLPYTETVRATWIRAVYSRRQLHEVMVDFWHNHFSVYGGHDDVAPLLPDYDNKAIRPHVLGNFGRMLGAVARHPVMLLYLDNSSLNENFARELLELHTLGAAHYLGTLPPTEVEMDSQGFARGYVDNDVYEVARCFSGWTLDESDSDDTSGGTGRFVCKPEEHDRFNKLVLGRYLRSDQGAMVDGSRVLDILAEHPATAKHIAMKLCRRFVSDQPPPELVARAANLFYKTRNRDDQLRQVVALILRSPEFVASAGAKFKRPLEYAVSLLRASAHDFHADEDFLEVFDAAGQPLFGRLTPDGYPDTAQAWQHTSSLLFRWKLVNLVAPDQPGLSQLALSPDFQMKG